MSSKKIGFLKVFFVFFLMGPAVAWGGTINLQKLTGDTAQGQFKSLSRDIGLAISYIPASPAEPLGITGFDVGVEVTYAPLDTNDAFVTSSPLDFILVPKLHVQKGLPFGIDLGAIYSSASGLDFSIIGGEVKYAVLSGNVALPAVAVRGAFTKMTGIDSLDLSTQSIDLSVSKGFLFVTPFAGFGLVQTTATPKGVSLLEEQGKHSKPFVGVKISLALINFVYEADFSETPLHTLRVNVGW